MGEGGSIPFMAMLGKKFPKTQFVVTGVLGPHSNAHGPNEFLAHSHGEESLGLHRIDPGRSRVADDELSDSSDDDPKRATRRPLLLFMLVTLVVGAGPASSPNLPFPTWYAGLVQARASLRPTGCSRRSGPRFMS